MAPEKSGHVIPTRQKTDSFFTTRDPIAPPAMTFSSGVTRVEGYGAVAIFAVSDQPFTIEVNEAAFSDGTFVTTQTLASALVDGSQVVNTRITHNSSFMELVLTNTGGLQTVLETNALGIPIA